MKTRCSNPRALNYYLYGARGIKVCPEWLDFKGFRDWALSSGYSDDLSIDRRDSDGNYEPINCRWATPTAQARNTRVNVRYSYRGESLTIPEIAERIGMNSRTLWRRVRASGMPLDVATTRPLRKYNR